MLPAVGAGPDAGIRPSEYLALKWSDIDWQRGTASVCRTIQITGSTWTFDDTKRKRSRRIVKLHNVVLKALQQLREKQEDERQENHSVAHEPILVSAAGLPLKQRTGEARIRRLLAIAGIRPVRLYDLRHTAATLAIELPGLVGVIAS